MDLRGQRRVVGQVGPGPARQYHRQVHRTVAHVDAVKIIKHRTKTVIVAGGAAEQPAIYANNDLQAVMHGSAPQSQIARFSLRTIRRTV